MPPDPFNSDNTPKALSSGQFSLATIMAGLEVITALNRDYSPALGRSFGMTEFQFELHMAYSTRVMDRWMASIGVALDQETEARSNGFNQKSIEIANMLFSMRQTEDPKDAADYLRQQQLFATIGNLFQRMTQQ